LRLRGERSTDEIEAAIGKSGGLIVRVHVERDEMHVYFAAEESAPTADITRTLTRAEAPTEVSKEEATQLRSVPGQPQGA
jgi:hypothetical protein